MLTEQNHANTHDNTADNASETRDMAGEITETRADFARRLGVSRQYIDTLGKQGRLVLTPDGQRIRVSATLAAISESADPARGGVGADRTQKIGDALRLARLRREVAKAEQAEMEVAALAGRLLDAAAVADAVYRATAILRARAEAWSDVLLPDLAALAGDLTAQRALLQARIDELISEFHHGMHDLAKQEHTA